ncbi:MAG: hypothetical protein ACJ795_05070 [Ktedonobacteraceae bacterium]
MSLFQPLPPSKHLEPARRSVPLTTRVQVLLVLAVVLPLLVTAIGSELILRPTLLSQAEVAMGSDAQQHAQTIDALLVARLEDLGFLGQFLAIREFLSGQETFQQQATNELAAGYHLDPNYNTWTLFDVHGKVKLSYPALPTPRGKYMIPPEITQQLQGVNKTLISDVYFDDNIHAAFIDIYTSITSSNGKLLGFGRSTLNMNEIWTAVNSETNAAPGSYAMIVDGHGVRIAYTNTDATLTTLPQALFKAVAPLSLQFQQRISTEDIYGNSFSAVKVLSDPMLANMQQHPQETATFQLVPALQNQSFQAYQVTCQIVPWTYLVLRPVNTITQAANQQDIYLILIAAVVTLLAAIVGLVVGRGITRPILRSVSSLLGSSQNLKMLSSNEQVTATEQKWIVESSENGLKSVQYYVGAASVAAHKLTEVSVALMQNVEWLDVSQTKQYLNEIIQIAHYMEKASSHQAQSNKSLSTAIRVTNQVTEQLVSGANSAAEAATQLEEVIGQLRQVVGK